MQTHARWLLVALLALASLACGGGGPITTGQVQPWWPQEAQAQAEVNRLVVLPNRLESLSQWPLPPQGQEEAGEPAAPRLGNDGQNVWRLWLGFDLQALPAQAHILSARLHLRNQRLHRPAPAQEEVWLRCDAAPRATSGSWRDQPPQEPLAQIPTSGQLEDEDVFEVTQAVRRWHKAQSRDTGFLVRALHEGQTFCKSYHGRKHATVLQGPRLHIIYTLQAP